MIAIEKHSARACRLLTSAAVCAFLASCAMAPSSVEPIPFPKPIELNRKNDAPETITSLDPSTQARNAISAEPGPSTPINKVFTDPIVSSDAPAMKGQSISINFDGIRLPAFVNTVFGELLGVTFEIESSISQREQLVTLRTAEPLPPQNFLELVEEVLRNYGVSVVYANGVYRVIDSGNAKQEIPRIIRTRANVDIPQNMRPIFYFLPLRNVSNQTMTVWLQMAMPDRVRAVTVSGFNGLLLLGSAKDIQSTVDLMEILDQPFLAGAESLKIAPAYWSARKLADQLRDILTAEGYNVGINSETAVKLLPIEALNIIIVFGTGKDTLRHVLRWAEELDQPSQTVSSRGAYYHKIYNAKAEDIADIVETLLTRGGILKEESSAQKDDTSNIRDDDSTRLVVDKARNAIIFLGTAEEYAQFRTLVAQMDHAPLAVMIEATIAEITLSKNESLGFSFGFNDGAIAAPNNQVVTTGSGGLFYSLVRSNSQMTAQLSALAGQNRIQILSSPRIVTNSGESAGISVGSDVPIITAQETSPNSTVGGTSSILQSVQYRSTGIILNISPTVNSSRRVELEISQEVSSAQPNDTSSVSSPIILRRSINTTLSVDDGQTVLLGGLISENFTDGDNGVPYLKDIPFIGNLFKKQSRSVERTELIVLLTPYIIDGPDTARQIREGFAEKITNWSGEAMSWGKSP